MGLIWASNVVGRDAARGLGVGASDVFGGKDGRCARGCSRFGRECGWTEGVGWHWTDLGQSGIEPKGWVGMGRIWAEVELKRGDG